MMNVFRNKSSTDAEGKETLNEYDNAGRLSKITRPDNEFSTISYDPNGLLETLITPLGKTLTFTYNANNLLTQIDFDGQMTTTYQYDNKSRLTSINSLKGLTPIDSNAYQFDQVDLRTSHFIQGLGTATYQYDQIDRLASAGHDYTLVNQEIFNMDPEGNILSSHDQASTTFDVANRIQAHPDYNFTFDKKGNLTQKVKISNGDKTVYTWNSVNQLTKLEFFALGGGISSPTLDFSYDAQGRRISRTLNGTDKTSWVYMGPHIHREYRNGTLSKRFIYGPGIDNILAAEIDTNSDGALDTTRFYLKDSLNTVSVITDDLGNPLQKYVFDSYGALKEIQGGGGTPILAGSGNWVDQPFTYTAREYDWVTGLLYYRARTYDPTLKRFLSEDPVWFSNLYQYSGTNPINFNDPVGQNPFLVGIEIEVFIAAAQSAITITAAVTTGVLALAAGIEIIRPQIELADKELRERLERLNKLLEDIKQAIREGKISALKGLCPQIRTILNGIRQLIVRTFELILRFIDDECLKEKLRMKLRQALQNISKLENELVRWCLSFAI